MAMPDMMLTMFLGMAMGFFALARFGGEHEKRYFGCFYGAVGFAFLTKGPVAPVVVLLAMLMYWTINLKSAHLSQWRSAWPAPSAWNSILPAIRASTSPC